MKKLSNLKVGDQVAHGTYGNALTVISITPEGKGVKIVYQQKDGTTLENTYSGRTLNIKVKLVD